MAWELARSERERLKDDGTFIVLEELVCEIGDELTRQMLGGKMVERADAADELSRPCPTCDCPCQRASPQQRRLLSTRGEVNYHEPAYHCRYCRRSFFPGSRFDGFTGPCYGDSETDSADGWGREQSAKF